MRTFWIAVILLLCAGVVASQTSTTTSSLTVPATAVATNCPVPVAGSTNYCFAADRFQVSQNGSAYVVIWPGAMAAPSLTLNGITKTLPASFTIAASAPTGTVTIGSPPIVATAPIVTAQ